MTTTGPDVSDELFRWLDPPYNRSAFQRMDQILTVATIGRGHDQVRRLDDSAATSGLEGLGGEAGTAAQEQFLERSCTDGFLVMRGDTILVEDYRNAMTPQTRHCLMSVSKSLAGMLAGSVIRSGLLDLEARVSSVVPELDSSGYGDATVQQVLDMAVALQFGQDYDDPSSEVQTEDRAAGWRPSRPGDPPDSKSFLASLRKQGEHGTRLQYCSTTTDVLAWLLERATGQPYQELLSSRLWSQIGAADDAYVTVDAAGFPYACAGVCATLRDLARFGLLVLQGGTWEGRSVVPTDWIAETRFGHGSPVSSDPAHAAICNVFPDAVYHNQWWTTRDEHGSVFGAGIFGQYLWLDPTTNLVIVKLSSLPAAFDPEDVEAHLRFLRDLARSLT